MRSNRTSAGKMIAANPLMIGAAFLALVSFGARSAFAQSIAIFHDNTSNPSSVSNNPFDTFHTVVGQVSSVAGHCAELGVCTTGGSSCRDDAECGFNGPCLDVVDPDADNDAGTCTVDTDCDGGSEDFCSFSGYATGITVTGGPNVGAGNTTYELTDVVGQVSFTYQDLGGVGTDSIEACLDTDQPPDDPADDPTVAGCIAGGPEDVDSNILTKNWLPTVVLSPPGAFNPAGGSHTVTATLNGVTGKCTVTGTACTSDAACSAGNTCDLSGFAVGIMVTSGINFGALGTDPGIKLTNSKGQVTMTYTDTNGAGTDFIQACSDGDFADASTGACLADAAAGGGDSPFDDIASNVSKKVWGAQVATLTPPIAFNPIGVQHLLTTTLTSGFANICSDGTKTCTTNADCTGGATCGQAGYPVFFAVVGTCTGGNNGGAICTSNADCNSNVCTGGPNLGDIGQSTTNSSGVATKSYTSAVEGQDTIQACVDADIADGPSPDDVNFIECLNDSGAELEVPTNTVVKNWFANFVTGGGGVNVGSGAKKKNLHGSGNVGKAGLAGIQGDWEAVSQIGTKTVSCHFNTFTSLVFSGPPAKSPPSTHDTAMFTTGPGKCNDGSSPTLTVTIVDLGEGNKVPRDTLNIVSTDIRFNTGGTLPLVTGNYQVHSITP